MSVHADDLILVSRRRPHLRAGRHVRRPRARRSTATGRRASSTSPTAPSSGATATSGAATSGSTRSRASRRRCSTSTRSATTRCGPAATTCTSACATCRPAGSSRGSTSPTGPASRARCSTQGPDRDVNLVMIQAYNDWHVDEWCGAYPGPVHPVRDPAALRRRGGGQGGAPPRRQGLPRGHVLGEPGRRSACRASTPTPGTRCSRRAATPGRCCAATSARRRRARRRHPTRRRRCR